MKLEHVLENCNQAQKVLIEAAHIYADQQPGSEQAASAKIAAGILVGINQPVHRMVLVDDYNSKNTQLYIPNYLQWLKGLGFQADEIVTESSLVDDGFNLLERIRQTVSKKKLTPLKKEDYGSNGGVGLWTRIGKIPLVTPSSKASCALLDAALYLKKAQQADLSVTILPESYMGQQQATFEVLKKLGESIKVVNIFYSPNNGLSNLRIKYWGGDNLL